LIPQGVHSKTGCQRKKDLITGAKEEGRKGVLRDGGQFSFRGGEEKKVGKRISPL